MNSIFDQIWNYELLRISIDFDLRGLTFDVVILIFSILLALVCAFIVIWIADLIINGYFDNTLVDDYYLWIFGVSTILLTLYFLNNFSTMPILSLIYSASHDFILSLKFLIIHLFTIIITIGTVVSIIILILSIMAGIYIAWMFLHR